MEPTNAEPNMAAIQGRVIEIRPDEGCRFMDPIAVKYTSAPFPSRGADRVCFVVEIEKAGRRALGWLQHRPAQRDAGRVAKHDTQ